MARSTTRSRKFFVHDVWAEVFNTSSNGKDIQIPHGKSHPTSSMQMKPSKNSSQTTPTPCDIEKLSLQENFFRRAGK
jgi:hypothetical protein